MIDFKAFTEIEGAFSEVTSSLNDYLRDDVVFTANLASASVAPGDGIYLGLEKPFPYIYAELIAGDPVSNFKAYYWDGSAWIEFTMQDDTLGFSRSGFIQFNEYLSNQKTTVNGFEAYWIRIIPQISSVTLKGLNVVYADDQDLKKEMRDIDNFKAEGDTSFIAYHVAARDEIVRSIVNAGKMVERTDGTFRNFSKWDIPELDYVRDAAKFLTLSKIMFDVSDNNDDKYYQKHRDFKAMFGHSINTFYEKIDLNNDGKIDNSERFRIGGIKVSKV